MLFMSNVLQFIRGIRLFVDYIPLFQESKLCFLKRGFDPGNKTSNLSSNIFKRMTFLTLIALYAYNVNCMHLTLLR